MSHSSKQGLVRTDGDELLCNAAVKRNPFEARNVARK